MVNADGRQPLAIVTGASSGIGLAVSLQLAQRGYRTVLIARRTDRLAELARNLSACAPSFPYTVDLADMAELSATAERIEREHGAPDVLVNNAGFGLYRPFLEVPVETHRTMMEVNYFAAVWLTRAVLPGMIKRGSGHIISVASISTKMGPWGHSSYSASKCALVSLMQTLASEYGETGVHFSYVNPGVVRTEYFMHPSFERLSKQLQPYWISADRVARGIVKLLDRPRLELCVPAHYRVLDWLRAISPTLLHRLIARQSRPKAGDSPMTVSPAPAPQPAPDTKTS